MKSTSFHRISADKKNILYKLIARVLHTPLNYINNLFPYTNIDSRIAFTEFKPENLEDQYRKLSITSSPSRKLSDLFWQNLEWDKLKNKNNEINICDVGCGTGLYFEKFQHYSNFNIINYQGIEINKNKKWDELLQRYPNIRFTVYDEINLANQISEKTNLIVSQSALEHFSEDLSVFRQIRAFIEKSGEKVTQIHLFPAKASLKLYPFHGVRQYTPRNISKITRLFSNGFSMELVGLGGKNCSKVHRKFIANGIFGKDIRNKEPDKYNIECFKAIQKDIEKKSPKNPLFYALIIRHDDF